MKNKFASEVADGMDKLLQDSAFNSVFSSGVKYDDALQQDAQYKAFVRIASKVCEKCGANTIDGQCQFCPPVPTQPQPPVGPNQPQTPQPGTPPAVEVAAALEYIIDNLLKTSVALENLNLKRSASITIAIANGILKEAAHEMGQESLFDDNDFGNELDFGKDETSDVEQNLDSLNDNLGEEEVKDSFDKVFGDEFSADDVAYAKDGAKKTKPSKTEPSKTKPSKSDKEEPSKTKPSKTKPSKTKPRKTKKSAGLIVTNKQVVAAYNDIANWVKK